MHEFLCRTLGMFILLGLGVPGFAQTALFSGRVSDPQQAMVSGAQVRIVNQATRIEREASTNTEGLYTVPFVVPGIYLIYVTATGFSTAVSDPLTVTLGQELIFNVQLKIGNSRQEIAVRGEMQMLNTTDAAVSTTSPSASIRFQAGVDDKLRRSSRTAPSTNCGD